MHGLPKVALEVGAELPELSQVADVVDLEPTFRVAAGGTLVEAQVSLRAAYEDVEIDVRADGMTLPVIVKPPPPPAAAEAPRAIQPGGRREGRRKRAKCIRCDIAAQQARGREAARSGPGARRRRQQVHRPRRRRHPLLDRGHRDAARSVGHLRSGRPRRRARSRRGALGERARRRAASTGCRLRLNFESEGVAVTQDELARCLADGRKYVRLADGTFARIDPQKVREVLQRQAEILATGGGNGGRLPLSQAGPHRRPPRAGRPIERHRRHEGPLQEAPGHRRDQGDPQAAQPEGAAPPVSGAGLSLALVSPRDRQRRRPGRRHGSRQDGADARAAARGEERGLEDRRQAQALQGAHRRADERRDELAARDGQASRRRCATRSGTAPSAASGRTSSKTPTWS